MLRVGKYYFPIYVDVCCVGMLVEFHQPFRKLVTSRPLSCGKI